MAIGILTIVAVGAVPSPQVANAAPAHSAPTQTPQAFSASPTGCGVTAARKPAAMMRVGATLLWVTKTQCDIYYAQDIAACQRANPSNAAARAVCYAGAAARYATCLAAVSASAIIVSAGGTVVGGGDGYIKVPGGRY
jgi:hypothetical protein